jgi:hypothetical protein
MGKGNKRGGGEADALPRRRSVRPAGGAASSPWIGGADGEGGRAQQPGHDESRVSTSADREEPSRKRRQRSESASDGPNLTSYSARPEYEGKGVLNVHACLNFSRKNV